MKYSRKPQSTRGNHKVLEETIKYSRKLDCMRKPWSTRGNHRVHEETLDRLHKKTIEYMRKPLSTLRSLKLRKEPAH